MALVSSCKVMPNALFMLLLAAQMHAGQTTRQEETKDNKETIRIPCRKRWIEKSKQKLGRMESRAYGIEQRNRRAPFRVDRHRRTRVTADLVSTSAGRLDGGPSSASASASASSARSTDSLSSSSSLRSTSSPSSSSSSSVSISSPVSASVSSASSSINSSSSASVPSLIPFDSATTPLVVGISSDSSSSSSSRSSSSS